MNAAESAEYGIVMNLQRYFGSDGQGWLNLQTAYDMRVAEKVNDKTISKQISPLAMVI